MKESKEQGEESSGQHQLIWGDTKRACLGGGLAALVTFLGAWTVGEVSGGEAHRLLQTALNTTRAFCGTVTLATGNILALMLTLLGLSANSDIDLKWTHYQRVKEIALADTITLIGSILIYLLLNLPLEESDPKTDPNQQMTYFYYTTLVLASILGGAVITVILMLYNAIRDIILAMSPKKEETPDYIANDPDSDEG